MNALFIRGNRNKSQEEIVINRGSQLHLVAIGKRSLWTTDKDVTLWATMTFNKTVPSNLMDVRSISH